MTPPLDMADFLAAAHSEQQIRIEADLGNGFVRLRSEEAERRQAIHDIRSSEDVVIELLRNARDAGAGHIYLATTKEGSLRTLAIIDDGCGIPESMHKEIFEPRVTSKLDTMALDKWGVHGRGMALFSITVNTSEARVASSIPNVGTALAVVIDTSKLSEKRDQSSFPTFEMTEPETIAMRGPKNIIRTTCEFAFDTPKTQVYLGSPTEIAATLYHHGLRDTSAMDRIFSQEGSSHSFAEQLAYAQTPADFRKRAEAMGLTMSERSARRIMDNEIEPLASMVDQLTASLAVNTSTDDTRPTPRPAKPAQAPLTSFSPQDLDQFRTAITDAYQSLAEAYYLDATQQPTIKLSKGILHIAIPVEKQR